MVARVRDCWGLTIPLPGLPLASHAEVLRECVDLGFTDLWTAEVAGTDAFTPLAAAAIWAPEVRLGTAIASVFSRGPALLAMEAASLAELAPGRFVLGLGSSSPLMGEGWNDRRYERPLGRVRDTLRFLRRSLAGERIEEGFDTFSVAGFALERPPAAAPPIFLAALQERMRELALAEADGLLLGLVTADDVARIVPPHAGCEVALRLGVWVESDERVAREKARRLTAAYLNVPAYAALHRSLGRAEVLGPMWSAWEAGDRKAALAATPDELVDELFVYGSPERCRDRIARFVDAGVTTPILSLMSPASEGLAALRLLAPGG